MGAKGAKGATSAMGAIGATDCTGCTRRTLAPIAPIALLAPGSLIGERDHETSAPFRPVLRHGLAAVQFHKVPYDGQAKTGSAWPCARLVHPVEPLEDARQIFGRNSGA